MIQNKTQSKNQLGLTLLYSLGIFLFGSIKTKELVYVGSFFSDLLVEGSLFLLM